MVYDLKTKELLFQEPNANSVAWNTHNEVDLGQIVCMNKVAVFCLVEYAMLYGKWSSQYQSKQLPCSSTSDAGNTSVW